MTEIILFAVGLVIGGMNSISGGGMLFGFPVLIAFGVQPIVASATTNIIVLPGNIAAIWGYRKHLHKIPKRYLLLLIPISIGGACGALMLKHVSPEKFNAFIPFLVFLAVALFAFQPRLYRYLRLLHRQMDQLNIKTKPLVVMSLITFPIAVYGGFFGAGFGFIMLAFLSFTKLRNHIHRINAFKSIITSIVAFVALICLLNSNLIHWHYGLIMSVGCLIGGYLGATRAQKVSVQSIRIFIVLTGLCTAAYLSLARY